MAPVVSASPTYKPSTSRLNVKKDNGKRTTTAEKKLPLSSTTSSEDSFCVKNNSRPKPKPKSKSKGGCPIVSSSTQCPGGCSHSPDYHSTEDCTTCRFTLWKCHLCPTTYCVRCDCEPVWKS